LIFQNCLVAVKRDAFCYAINYLQPMRLMILGNSGSGKSTLAKRLGASLLLPIHDLDHVHWHADGRKREEAEAKALVADLATTPVWIIEGVYGWLAEVALLRATALIWIDLSWPECQDGLLRRGLRRGMTRDDQDALLAWAGAYWTRTTPSSFRGHELLYNAFAGSKWHLQSRAELSAFSVTFDG
jgi:hypothetical protein